MKRRGAFLAIALVAASILAGCVVVPVDGPYPYRGYWGHRHYRPYPYYHYRYYP
jgi:hypothetical protein